MPTYLAPLLSVFVSLVAAIISYYNYTLNKTLNFKNQLFNEKLRKYIELSRKLAEFIEILDQAGQTLNQSSTMARSKRCCWNRPVKQTGSERKSNTW